jgi:uncharacterized protein (TIGR00661 family)
MKKIFYYITDHGKGHATRSIAIIKELEKNFEVIIRNSNAEDLIKKSLPKIQIIKGKTDQGSIIKNDGVSINKSKTKNKIEKWISELEKNSIKESQLISKYLPDLIISDISYMPFISAKKNNIPSIAISNFSWYDVMDSISKKNSKILYDSYENADFSIKLPFGTDMNHFKKQKQVSLVCRKTTQTKTQIRKKLKIKDSDKIILFALGNSNQKISCYVDKNIKLLSMGTDIRNYSCLNVSDWVDGQNIVAASDLVICKSGYGFVTECLANNVPFYHVYDDNHLEQKSIAIELEKLGINNRLKFKDFLNFNISNDIFNIKKLTNKIEIDTDSVIKIINQFVSK